MTIQTDAMAAGALAFMEAFRAIAADPADQVRLLTRLVGYAAPIPARADALGLQVVATQTATDALFRRAALVSLALACAQYQPSSSNDAAALLQSVTTLFDNEITVAADASEDVTYVALRWLRTEVANDLITRGAGLPALVQITLSYPEPSLVVAYRLYQDCTREPGLVQRADCSHPGFMPLQFEALNS